MKKRLIALALTVFLGAGIGHLYLKKFLKGAILIAANFTGAGLIVWRLYQEDPAFSALLSGKTAEPLEKFIQAYNNAAKTGGDSALGYIFMWSDLAMAALLAYALIDVWRLTADPSAKHKE